MAFSDPLALTIGGSVRNLVRIDSGRGVSEYSYSDATMKVTALIRNVQAKPLPDGRSRERHTISVKQTLFATATTPEITRLSSHTIENIFGDDVTAYDDIAIAVAGLITAPNVLKLANFES
jgi:hypothetical protein